jgi:hypothetical protein
MPRWTAFIALVVACGGGGAGRPPRTAGGGAERLQASDFRLQAPDQKAEGSLTAPGATVGCDDRATGDLSIDGLLDDWKGSSEVARGGQAPDGAVALHCAWDGEALALAMMVDDDRVVRVNGHAHEDRVSVSVRAQGGSPVSVQVLPGTQIARAKIIAPGRVQAADSLQPHGFSVEVLVPAAAIPGFSASTPALDVTAVFEDSDQATGGDSASIAATTHVQLGDRKDLLDDFLRDVRLARTDIKIDQLVDLDPDHKGNERLVAGGHVIGVLAEQYAYVTVPAEVRSIELLPLGRGQLQVIAAVARDSGNGGSRDLLMLWTVWSGQLQPLAQIEVRKELGASVLACDWKVVRGAKGPELVVTPKPAVGFTPDTWNEEPATDADPILLPWDATKSGIAYSLKGASLDRRDLPPAKKRR